MDRRALIGAATAVAGSVALAATVEAQDRGRWRYRGRRDRWRSGLLLKDIEGTANFEDRRRRGEFEGDCLIQSLAWGRKLTASGILVGEAEIDRRRRDDYEEDVETRFRRVGLDLSARRRNLRLDLAAIEVETGRRRDLEVNLDAVTVDDIRGPRGDELEELLEALAEAIADEDGSRKARKRDDDIEDLVQAINRLLARFLHVVEAGRRRD